jgi:hypothetical protein
MMTRRPMTSAVAEIPGRYDVADGGVYVRIGDQEIAVTSTGGAVDAKHESLLLAIQVVETLADGADAALTELRAALALLDNDRSADAA